MVSVKSYGQSSQNDQAKAYYMAAEEAFLNKQYNDALTAIEKVESLLGKSNARLSALKVKTHFEQEKFIEAKAEIDVFFGFKAKDVLAREISLYLMKVDNGIEKQKRKELAKKERVAREEADRIAREKEERDRLAREKTEHILREKARRLQVMRDVEKYTAIITRTIQSHLTTNKKTMSGKYCKLTISLAPSGFVINVVPKEGDKIVCEAAKNAVYKAGTLPISKDSNVFKEMRTMNLTVVPEF